MYNYSMESYDEILALKAGQILQKIKQHEPGLNRHGFFLSHEVYWESPDCTAEDDGEELPEGNALECDAELGEGNQPSFGTLKVYIRREGEEEEGAMALVIPVLTVFEDGQSAYLDGDMLEDMLSDVSAIATKGKSTYRKIRRRFVGQNFAYVSRALWASTAVKIAVVSVAVAIVVAVALIIIL